MHVDPARAAAEPIDPSAVGAAAFVLGLRSRGLRDVSVLSAMERVPRELFAPRRLRDLSRTDVSLPLPCGQTMTAPSTVAAMLVELKAGPGQRVLEVGTGSGYVAALLARLCGRVVTIERFGTLAAEAKGRVEAAGAGGAVRLLVGDGLDLRDREGRFDRVLVNGALRQMPPYLTALIAPGGCLVGAYLVDGCPRLLRIERSPEGELATSVGAPLRLTCLTPGRAEAL